MSKTEGFEVRRKESHIPRWLFPDIPGNHFEITLSPNVATQVGLIYRKVEKSSNGLATIEFEGILYAIQVQDRIARIFILKKNGDCYEGQVLLDDRQKGVVSGVFDPTQFSQNPLELEAGRPQPIRNAEELAKHQQQLLNAVFTVDTKL